MIVGRRRGGAAPAYLGNGSLTEDTVVYVASLAKQMTAACAALLVRRGRLDPESSLARWMPELPSWAGEVRVRHLIHHTGGLTDDPVRDEADRTTDEVLDALLRAEEPAGKPGTGFRYCNAGYVCLALVVERAAGQSFPDFAREQVFGPLGMADSRHWTGPGPHPPGAVPTEAGRPAALSLGDGGVWSTARDLMRWNEALERDELGVSELLHTPGRLDDGTPLDYGWGIGVRDEDGLLVHRHGGSWPGVCAQIGRIPALRASFVVLALDNDQERTIDMARELIGSLRSAV